MLMMINYDYSDKDVKKKKTIKALDNLTLAFICTCFFADMMTSVTGEAKNYIKTIMMTMMTRRRLVLAPPPFCMKHS